MSLIFTEGHSGREAGITQLFAETFTASEGADEGQQIGAFVSDLLSSTPSGELRLFTAHQGDALVGAVAFSRMRYPGDARAVFILSPAAVHPAHQRGGIGQMLISNALAELKAASTDYALTYGDPAYYGKTGFTPIDTAFAPAPLPLSFPHGWLGQPLSEAGKAPYTGTPACVPALNNPALW